MIETSQEIGELAKALASAQSEMLAAAKDGINPFFKGPDKPKGSSYATLASVWDACRGPLTKNGLSVSQLPVSNNGTVGVVTTLMHGSGQWMRAVLFAKPDKDTPQALGSAITYVRRYALAAVVGVAPEDDDGNEASGKTDGDRARKANEVSAKPSTPMIEAAQVQQIHVLKEKIGGWTGKDNDEYRKALAGYRKADGTRCTSSKDLTAEQAANLLKRMQDMFQRQAEKARKMEAESPIADSMAPSNGNGHREPGSDDDDTGEACDPGQLQNVREAAKSRWGKKAPDLAPQWLAKEFGVSETAALTKMQAERALQMLLSGQTL